MVIGWEREGKEGGPMNRGGLRPRWQDSNAVAIFRIDAEKGKVGKVVTRGMMEPSDTKMIAMDLDSRPPSDISDASMMLRHV